MKKGLTLLTSIAMAGVAVANPLMAYAAAPTPLKTDTEINITIEEAAPIAPQPEDPSDPNHNPDLPTIEGNENGDSTHNDSVTASDKLAIWRYPNAMKFKGTYNQFLDYVLTLDVGTEATASDSRVLSVVDIRADENNDKVWEVSAKIDNLKKQENPGSGSEVTTGFTFEADARTGKHKIDGLKIKANDFEAHDPDTDAKIVSPNNDGKIKITESSSVIAKAEAGKGKGYTGIIMENLKLKFTPGSAGEGTYKGDINWTLTDTASAPVVPAP